MEKIDKRIFLYSGLLLLLIAIVFRLTVGSSVFFWILFVAAISLKGLFLIGIFRENSFKLTLWLFLILTGVVLIFISIVFKTVFHIPLLRDILFYTAIALKITGLLLMLFQRRQLP